MLVSPVFLEAPGSWEGRSVYNKHCGHIRGPLASEGKGSDYLCSYLVRPVREGVFRKAGFWISFYLFRALGS